LVKKGDLLQYDDITIQFLQISCQQDQMNEKDHQNPGIL